MVWRGHDTCANFEPNLGRGAEFFEQGQENINRNVNSKAKIWSLESLKFSAWIDQIFAANSIMIQSRKFDRWILEFQSWFKAEIWSLNQSRFKAEIWSLNLIAESWFKAGQIQNQSWFNRDSIPAGFNADSMRIQSGRQIFGFNHDSIRPIGFNAEGYLGRPESLNQSINQSIDQSIAIQCAFNRSNLPLNRDSKPDHWFSMDSDWKAIERQIWACAAIIIFKRPAIGLGSIAISIA